MQTCGARVIDQDGVLEGFSEYGMATRRPYRCCATMTSVRRNALRFIAPFGLFRQVIHRVSNSYPLVIEYEALSPRKLPLRCRRQCCAYLVGIGFDHLRLLHVAGRVQPDAFMARENMKMKMKNFLSAGRFIELLNRDA
jgi:hypothetical protein